jgi:hypothetical protein
MGPPAYALAANVCVCRSGDYFVFLDLKRDRYFALAASTTGDLAAHVRAWPVSAPKSTGSANRTLELLRRNGLVTNATEAGDSPPPQEHGSPIDELREFDRLPRVRLASIVAMLAASVRAALLLRWRPLDRVTERVRRRRQAIAHRHSPDHCAVEELVSVFEHLRPFFFSARSACLFQSLALIEFLARHDCFPSWIFGVTTSPFAAHCWVQQDGLVFNDTVDHVRRYTPIMVV